MKDNKLHIILDEVINLLNVQQGGVDILYGKLNWILVSDIILLSILYSQFSINICVIILVTLSALVTLYGIVGLESRNFKITRSISKQLKDIDKESFLEDLIKKKREAYSSNKKEIKNMHLILQLSTFFLAMALIIKICNMYI